MTTLTEFTAEIIAKFPTYEKDIDKISIKTDVIDRLRKLGNNITYINETILEVENSKAKLPEDFKSLKLALKIKPKGCEIKGDKKQATESYIYKERIENPAYFDEVNQEYVTTCGSKLITEKITLNNSNLTYYYEPTWLSVTKGFNKTGFGVECLNLHPSIRNKYPHEINITQRNINTNFSNGQIYVQYYSLPTNEEGEIVIPEYTTGDIYNYIETYVKVRIAEDLIANNLNPQGIVQLYPTWVSQLRDFKRAALTESKFHGLGKKWQGKVKSINRREINKFNLPSLKNR